MKKIWIFLYFVSLFTALWFCYQEITPEYVTVVLPTPTINYAVVDMPIPTEEVVYEDNPFGLGGEWLLDEATNEYWYLHSEEEFNASVEECAVCHEAIDTESFISYCEDITVHADGKK